MGREPTGRPPGRPSLPTPAPDQPALDGLADAQSFGGKPGAMTAATRGAVAAGLEGGRIDRKLDAALGVLAVELARALDLSAARRDPYGVTTVSRELRAVLARLGLDPAARAEGTPGGGGGDVGKFLADLGVAEVRDPAQS